LLVLYCNVQQQSDCIHTTCADSISEFLTLRSLNRESIGTVEGGVLEHIQLPYNKTIIKHVAT